MNKACASNVRRQGARPKSDDTDPGAAARKSNGINNLESTQNTVNSSVLSHAGANNGFGFGFSAVHKVPTKRDPIGVDGVANTQEMQGDVESKSFFRCSWNRRHQDGGEVRDLNDYVPANQMDQTNGAAVLNSGDKSFSQS